MSKITDAIVSIYPEVSCGNILPHPHHEWRSSNLGPYDAFCLGVYVNTFDKSDISSGCWFVYGFDVRAHPMFRWVYYYWIALETRRW